VTDADQSNTWRVLCDMCYSDTDADQSNTWRVLRDMCYSDTDADQSNTWRVLCDLDLHSVASADDVAIMRYLCSALSIRASQLVAAGMLKHVMVCLGCLVIQLCFGKCVTSIKKLLVCQSDKLFNMNDLR